MIKTDSIPQPAPTATGISRRGIFALAGASAALAATPAAARTFGRGFTHSVASGEPGVDKVMLWTRYVGEQDLTLEFQVSETDDFANPVTGGSAKASADTDWCAKAWADGLLPDRWYFYRFVAPDGTMSPVGRTRTLPEGPTQKFRLAVFSCSNFGFGYFNAYAHAAEANDCDLAVHLGDYIYEYPRGSYPTVDEANADRELWPENEIVALADYRLRYATYRKDPDLQRIHQVLPMIAVWDDHESTNDSWKGGAENHQADTEGDWEVRKAVAKKAYYEWMPVAENAYSSYDIGDLATLFRLDTRLEGRDEQFSIGKVLEGQENPQAMIAALAAFRDGDYADPDRQLLGAVQEAWLAEGLAASTGRGAKWQVLVQQVLMGKLASPTGLVEQLGDSVPDYARGRLIAASLAAEAGLPLNMDAWDGYPAARDRVFKGALDAGANLLVLAGDTHNGWTFDLGHEGEKVGVEFGVSSVSSPGFERYLSMVPPAALAQMLVGTNDELKWADTAQRGYMTVELTPARATTEYRFVSGIRQRSTQLAGTQRIVTEAGSNIIST